MMQPIDHHNYDFLKQFYCTVYIIIKMCNCFHLGEQVTSKIRNLLDVRVLVHVKEVNSILRLKSVCVCTENETSIEHVAQETVRDYVVGNDMEESVF